MQQTQEQIWHCPCQPDRELADILVHQFSFEVWRKIATRFGKGYPHLLAEKYALIYRLIGCKK